MKSEKRYAVSKFFWLLPIAVTLFSMGIFWQPYNVGPRLFVVALNLFTWYGFLTMPLEIRVLADRSVLFKGVLKQTQLPVADIVAIEKAGKSTTIIHTGGKISFSVAIGNLENFYEQLKRLNPAITEDFGPFTKFVQTPRNFFLIMAGSLIAALAIAALVIILAG